MIPNDLNERRKMIQYMLEDLNKKHDEMTQWESDFIDSISDQFEDKRNLSDRQCAILESLFGKYEP